MVFYQLTIFNRAGKVLYTLECNKRKSKKGKAEQDQKLLFGLLHSLKSFVNHMNPCQLEPLDNEPMQSYTTKGYRLHLFETLSGLRFVLTTDPNVETVQDTLKQLFTIYADFAVKNPLYTMGDAIDCQLFVAACDDCLRKHPQFA